MAKEIRITSNHRVDCSLPKNSPRSENRPQSENIKANQNTSIQFPTSTKQQANHRTSLVSNIQDSGTVKKTRANEGAVTVDTTPSKKACITRSSTTYNNIGYKASNIIKNTTNTIEEAKRLFNEGKAAIKQELKKITSQDQVVLLLGNTGAGKSTLINYLSGCKLTAQKVNARWHIAAENPKVKIGNDLNNSATAIPELYKDQLYGLVYCDLPGFGDTRGTAQQIANSLLINEIATKARGIKVLIITSEAGLTDSRCDGLRKCTEQIKSMFSNHEQLRGKVSLVVTNLKHSFSVNNVKTQLDNIGRDNTDLRSMIELIEENIAVSHAPSSNGDIGSVDKDAILGLLCNRVGVLNNVQLSIPISEDQRSAIRNLVHTINCEINDQVKQIYGRIQQKCDMMGNSSVTDKQTGEKDIVRLNSILKQSLELQSLSRGKIKISNFEDLINKIEENASVFNIDISEFVQEATDCHNNLQFIEKLITVDEDVNLWISRTAEILKPEALKTKIDNLQQGLQKLKEAEAQEKEADKAKVAKAKDLAPARQISTPRSYNGYTATGSSSASTTNNSQTPESSDPTSKPSTPDSKPSEPKSNKAKYTYETEFEEYCAPGPDANDHYTRITRYYRVDNNGTREEISKSQYYRESGEEEPSTCIIS